MTLVLSFACANAVIQTSDRVLSTPGSQWDRRANKTVICVFPDAFAVLSYSGLAHVGGYITDEWVARTLADVWDDSPSPPPGRTRGGARWSGVRVGSVPGLLPFEASLERVAQGLEREARAFTSSEARQPPGVVVAGYRWYSDDPTEWFPAIWGIERRRSTVYEVSQVAGEPFDEPYKVCYFPRWETLTSEEIQAFRQQIEEVPTLAEVEDVLIEASRLYASRAPIEIGTDILSVRIEPGESLSPSVRFAALTPAHAVIRRDSTDSTVRVPVAFTPWFITPNLIAPPQQVTGFTELHGHVARVADKDVGISIRVQAPASTVPGLVAAAETQPRKRQPPRS